MAPESPEGDGRRGRLWPRGSGPLLVIAALTALLISIVFWDRVFIVVRSGEAGVYWNRFTGTRTDLAMGEGLHVLNPLNKMYIYEIRKQVAYHELDVLSSEGLRIRLDLAIRFNPELAMVGMLHERIGPDYLMRVVIPQTESVLRKQLGVATAEDIYTNKNKLLTRAILRAMREVGRNFVEVEDVIIRRITLPEEVRRAIEEKLRQQELMLSYAFRTETARLEAERLKIEGQGIRDAQGIVAGSLTDRVLVHESHLATHAIAEAERPTTLVLGARGDGLSVPVFVPHQGGATAGDPSRAPSTLANGAGDPPR